MAGRPLTSGGDAGRVGHCDGDRRGACLREAWALDPNITFLNHGSFGACPKAVLAVQSELRQRLEADPVRFFTREFEPLLDQARAALAGFIGISPADVVFVPNATTGVSTVLRSLRLAPGDELVVTNHAYRACRNAVSFVADMAGAFVVEAKIGFPAESDTVIDAILEATGPRTRLVLLDQVTSPTALIFPVATLVEELESRGILVLVDAAHAPGMVPLSLDQIGASFTTGNLHKWVCAPKGAGFLHVRGDRQDMVRPLVISHGFSAIRPDKPRFHREFDWVGTIDPTPYLCVPSVLGFMAALHPDGWPGLMRSNMP